MSKGFNFKKQAKQNKDRANIPGTDKLLEEQRDKFNHKTDAEKPEESLLRGRDKEQTEKEQVVPYNARLEKKHKGESEWKDLPEKKFEDRKAIGVPHRNPEAHEGNIPKLRELTNQYEKEMMKSTEVFEGKKTDLIQDKHIGEQKDLPTKMITQQKPQDNDLSQSTSTKYFDGDNASHGEDKKPYFDYKDYFLTGLKNGFNASAGYNHKMTKHAANEDSFTAIDRIDSEFISIVATKYELSDEDKKRIIELKAEKSKKLGLI